MKWNSGERVLLRKQVAFDWIEILILSSVWDNVKMQRLFSLLLLSWLRILYSHYVLTRLRRQSLIWLQKRTIWIWYMYLGVNREAEWKRVEIYLGSRVGGWLLLVPQSECTGLCAWGHWYPAVYGGTASTFLYVCIRFRKEPWGNLWKNIWRKPKCQMLGVSFLSSFVFLLLVVLIVLWWF